MCLENEILKSYSSNESENLMNHERMKDLEKKIQQIWMKKPQTKNFILEKEEKNVLACHQMIRDFCIDKREYLEGILMLIKTYAQGRQGQQDERVCTILIRFLLPLSHRYYHETKDGILKLLNESNEFQVEEIISVMCRGSHEDSILCDMILDFMKCDLIQGSYNREKCVLILMKWYFLTFEKSEYERLYDQFDFAEDQIKIAYMEYLLQERKYREIIDFSICVNTNNKFIYEALILAYNQTGNKELEKQFMLKYFFEFPKKETLDALLLILDEQEIELYHAQILESAMKSKEVFKEACLRIGNADDLYFLLRKGNLNLSERIHVLSCHTIELYKKDSDSTLSMMEKDLTKILHSANTPKPQLQDLVFAMSKFKKGREILERLVRRIVKEDRIIKELIQSVMEESRYVYGESYEAESWS